MVAFGTRRGVSAVAGIDSSRWNGFRDLPPVIDRRRAWWTRRLPEAGPTGVIRLVPISRTPVPSTDLD
jgi:hypothetical protein